MQNLFLKIVVLTGVIGGSCAVVWQAHKGIQSAVNHLDAGSFVALDSADSKPEANPAGADAPAQSELEPTLAMPEPEPTLAAPSQGEDSPLASAKLAKSEPVPTPVPASAPAELPAFFADEPPARKQPEEPRSSARSMPGADFAALAMPQQTEPAEPAPKEEVAANEPAPAQNPMGDPFAAFPTAMPSQPAEERSLPALPQPEPLAATMSEPTPAQAQEEPVPTLPNRFGPNVAEAALPELPAELPSAPPTQRAAPPAMPGLTRLPPSNPSPVLLPAESVETAGRREMSEFPGAVITANAVEESQSVEPVGATENAAAPKPFLAVGNPEPLPTLAPKSAAPPSSFPGLPTSASEPTPTPAQLPALPTQRAAAVDPWSTEIPQPTKTPQQNLATAEAFGLKSPGAPAEMPPLPPTASAPGPLPTVAAEVLPEIVPRNQTRSQGVTTADAELPADFPRRAAPATMPAQEEVLPTLSLTSGTQAETALPSAAPSPAPAAPMNPFPAADIPPMPPTGTAPAANMTTSPQSPPTNNALIGTAEPEANAPSGPQSPELKIEKIAPPEAVIGEPVVYSIIIRNVGGSAARDVVVEDRIPKGAQLEGTIPQAYLNEGKLSWQLGTIPSGEERKIQLKVIPLESGQIGSVATVSFAAAVSASIKVTAPQLAISMNGPEEAVLGEHVTYQFKLQNRGQGTAKAVFLRTILPPGLKHPGGNDLEYEAGSLAPGAEKIIDLTVTPEHAGTFTPVAQISNDSKTHAETRADLHIIKSRLELSRTGPENRFVGRPAPCVTRITNNSTRMLNNLTIQEKVAPGVELANVPRGGRWDPRTRLITWTLPQLNPGESREMNSLYVASAGGDHVGSLIAVDDAGNRAEIKTVLSVKGFADLTADITAAQRTVLVGERVTLRLTLKNEGTAAAKDVRAKFTFPAGFEFAAAHGPTEYAIQGQTIQFEPLPEIAMAGQQVYEIALIASAAGSAKVTMQLESAEYSEPLVRDQPIRVVSTGQ
ncbi:DUF11 domain-containing protein [Planctomicrobium piriforme]|uniref:60 kDa outer membrane protein n=1 Tax=Planctomicrobium piriforme TaxID=1576369 RepID=A0A1I3BA51_9PLAN|nr:DUF11 domain-containing protein [Planctomicrobium piriforme]SFH59175.1 conserved repeat domain-containing protein [Planctomicrobium piriforme]